MMHSVNKSKEYLGEVRPLGLFQKANLTRLTGQYNQANEEYEEYEALLATLSPEKDYNFYVKVIRQYADLKFLQGDFKKSLSILESCLMMK
jgi:hypothetical protein